MATRLAPHKRLAMLKPDMKKHGRRAFWAWIAYQTIKGTLTTSLIWVPLIIAYWR